MKSIASYVLCLVGGIGLILSGFGNLIAGTMNYYLPELVNNYNVNLNLGQNILFVGILAFFWLVIMGVLAIFAGILMVRKKDSDVKTGGILSLVVGVLSLNLIVIVAGALGIAYSSKKS